MRVRAKSTDHDKLTENKLTAKQRFRYSDFVTDFVAVISSQSEGLGKMALGIAKIYLGSPNRRCSRSVCYRSVGSRSVCRGQLSWTHEGNFQRCLKHTVQGIRNNLKLIL